MNDIKKSFEKKAKPTEQIQYSYRALKAIADSFEKVTAEDFPEGKKVLAVTGQVMDLPEIDYRRRTLHFIPIQLKSGRRVMERLSNAIFRRENFDYKKISDRVLVQNYLEKSFELAPEITLRYFYSQGKYRGKTRAVLRAIARVDEDKIYFEKLVRYHEKKLVEEGKLAPEERLTDVSQASLPILQTRLKELKSISKSKF